MMQQCDSNISVVYSVKVGIYAGGNVRVFYRQTLRVGVEYTVACSTAYYLPVTVSVILNELFSFK